MVEVERDFARAWDLMTELASDPPDIVFLDVMFDIKTTEQRELEASSDRDLAPFTLQIWREFDRRVSEMVF